ncbi:MAG: energy transducer TonB [Rubrivivax sp.]|nr:energy transducer TonB [Rubrivivax sp.]
MGRQLDEEAARRDAAAAARPDDQRPHAWSSLRRGRIFGRADAHAELALYAEAWARRIHLNTAADTFREAAQKSHRHPMVTVAVRSDGSVESVTVVVPSGVPELDEAIRRIVMALAPYPPFLPALARDYDVVEIRRTWHFDAAVQLY